MSTTPKAYDDDNPSLEDAVRRVVTDMLARLQLPMPARVVSYDSSTQCCDAQPVVPLVGREGEPVTLPLVRCCQVGWMRVGGSELVGRLSEGDLVWLLPSGCSLGAWWTSGSEEATPESPRRGSLSDAIAIPLAARPRGDVVSSPSSGLDVRGGSHLGLSGGEVIIGGSATTGEPPEPAGLVEITSNLEITISSDDTLSMGAVNLVGITSDAADIAITAAAGKVEVEAPEILLGAGATDPVALSSLVSAELALISAAFAAVNDALPAPLVPPPYAAPGSVAATQTKAK